MHNIYNLIVYIIKHPVSTTNKFLEMFKCCTEASTLFSRNFFHVLKRSMRLLLRGFHGEEAKMLGLLNPNLSDSDLIKFTSKSEMLKIQEKPYGIWRYRIWKSNGAAYAISIEQFETQASGCISLVIGAMRCFVL